MGKEIWNLLCIFALFVTTQIQPMNSQEATQTASYLCFEDQQNSSLIHLDFILDRKTDVVTSVYANEFQNCVGSSQDGGQTYIVRVTFSINSGTQLSPSQPCGMTITSDGSYQLNMRSEASSGLVSYTDRIYDFKCHPTRGISPWATTSGISVGVDLLNLTGSRTTELQVVSASDTSSLVLFANLGDLVRFKFRMTFTSAIENIDVLGVRLTNLICSPSDTFTPKRRILIDDNGCAVNYTENALALSGPFTTESNGSSPFIALSPVFEIGRFADSFELNFIVTMEYCTSSSGSCFTDMCTARKKRSADGVIEVIAKTKINVYQQSEVNTHTNNTGPVETHDCFLTWMFAAVAGTVFVILFIDGFVIAYLVRQLKGLPHKQQPTRPTVMYPRINTSTTSSYF
ncbi:uncharacterized protein LOC110466607 isoform X2 [Mizuhopecten yessoensis]|uniref:ZP domain-containing protein n=1 Tax=Mizuhopecten yessoensis TaxID=6573 RepID=A0A210PNN2_MIZYE|nr:uncharacterized protein LOC110466607 isoform X2 [Mizuhopecten yessoensis]OWF38115.1 hypothetical protein KP79_PYT08857 [Mizuhopecten yessoensis]